MKKFVLPLSLTLALVGCSLFPVEPERPPDPSAARDPGARAGAAGTGGPLAGLTATELAFFNTGKDDFVEVENVVDGLGPTMNLDSCAGCHVQPAVGGTRPRCESAGGLCDQDAGHQHHSIFHYTERARAGGAVREEP